MTSGRTLARTAARVAAAAALACGVSTATAGTIVECVDARGVAVLSNAGSASPCVGSRGGPRPTSGERAAVATRAASPADFPRVDAATQRARDSDRARILRDELASEEGRLSALESTPRPPVRDANGTSGAVTSAATAAVAEQLARARENIRALQRELAGVR